MKYSLQQNILKKVYIGATFLSVVRVHPSEKSVVVQLVEQKAINLSIGIGVRHFILLQKGRVPFLSGIGTLVVR